ncbi:MAG TPA: SDR family NAD(P)-dependent oxidoreductase [Bacteroidales bacterium]|jgi:short-subunit dehydrogenase|nr:SDR family NAD(P)-dependent oxidoreductase [Bacteroidales bacterium]
MSSRGHFSGKTAWITGASSGIGEALVYELAGRGARLIISSNDPEGLQRVRKACGDNQERVTCVPFDLSDSQGIKEIAETHVEEAGGIDFLFNIGGISQRARIEETPLWLDRKIFEINYFGTIALTKAVLPYMQSKKSGHILATSSITGRFGFPLRSAYSASKQALHGFFETLYLENKNNNIKTSVIIPGRVRTNISFHALDGEGREHGRMDDGQASGLLPSKAAKIILNGIRKDKREILVGKWELALLFIRRICPPLFFRIADRIKST